MNYYGHDPKLLVILSIHSVGQHRDSGIEFIFDRSKTDKLQRGSSHCSFTGRGQEQKPIRRLLPGVHTTNSDVSF